MTMKENIQVNLFGTIYHMDKDAYELLKKYEDNMRQYFSRREDGDEIADDIEHRVAELIEDLRQNGTEAITIEHVEDIIRRIGRPEDFADPGKDGDGAETDSTDGQARQAFGRLRDNPIICQRRLPLRTPSPGHRTAAGLFFRGKSGACHHRAEKMRNFVWPFPSGARAVSPRNITKNSKNDLLCTNRCYALCFSGVTRRRFIWKSSNWWPHCAACRPCARWCVPALTIRVKIPSAGRA